MLILVRGFKVFQNLLFSLKPKVVQHTFLIKVKYFASVVKGLLNFLSVQTCINLFPLRANISDSC